MGITEALMIAVPSISGLLWLSFFYPGIFMKHVLGPLLAAPFLVFGLSAIWIHGAGRGALEQLRADKSAAAGSAEVALKMQLVPSPLDLTTTGLVAAGTLLFGVLCAYVATVSPKRAAPERTEDTPRS